MFYLIIIMFISNFSYFLRSNKYINNVFKIACQYIFNFFYIFQTVNIYILKKFELFLNNKNNEKIFSNI